jgi:hypothetical protein
MVLSFLNCSQATPRLEGAGWPEGGMENENAKGKGNSVLAQRSAGTRRNSQKPEPLRCR